MAALAYNITSSLISFWTLKDQVVELSSLEKTASTSCDTALSGQFGATISCLATVAPARAGCCNAAAIAGATVMYPGVIVFVYMSPCLSSEVYLRPTVYLNVSSI